MQQEVPAAQVEQRKVELLAIQIHSIDMVVGHSSFSTVPGIHSANLVETSQVHFLNNTVDMPLCRWPRQCPKTWSFSSSSSSARSSKFLSCLDPEADADPSGANDSEDHRESTVACNTVTRRSMSFLRLSRLHRRRSCRRPSSKWRTLLLCYGDGAQRGFHVPDSLEDSVDPVQWRWCKHSSSTKWLAFQLCNRTRYSQCRQLQGTEETHVQFLAEVVETPVVEHDGSLERVQAETCATTSETDAVPDSAQRP